MFGLHALSAEQPIKYMFTAGVRNPICSHQKSHTLTKKTKTETNLRNAEDHKIESNACNHAIYGKQNHAI